MISSVFGKTKPINYIILLSILFIIYWTVNLYLYKQTLSPTEWVLKTLALGFLMFTLFVVNFVVKRNQITGSSTYAILFFTLFILFFPEVLRDTNAIFCGFFIALAFRRIVSMRSLRNLKLKLFDASLWIVTSSIFYDWALLFIILVFMAIYMYEPKNFRNWLVPIAAAITFVSILLTALATFGNTSYLFEHYTFNLNVNPGLLFSEPHGFKIIGYVLLVLVTGLLAFARIGKLGLGRILSMRLVVVCFIVGLIVTILETSTSAYPIFITFFPGATLVTKYVETIKRMRLKEVFLIFTIVIPLITWVAQHVVN